MAITFDQRLENVLRISAIIKNCKSTKDIKDEDVKLMSQISDWDWRAIIDAYVKTHSSKGEHLQNILTFLNEIISIVGWLKNMCVAEDDVQGATINESRLTRLEVIKSGYIPATSEGVEEAPPIPVTHSGKPTIEEVEDEDFIKTLGMSKVTKRQRTKKTKVILELDTPGISAERVKDFDEITVTEDVEREPSVGQAVFPEETAMAHLVYIPPVRKAVDDKGVPLKKEQIKKDSKWAEIVPESYVYSATLTKAGVEYLLSKHLISSFSYPALLAGATKDEDQKPRILIEEKDLTPEQIANRKRWMTTAKVNYYLAQSEGVLDTKSISEGKRTFVGKWMKRLLDVPEPLDPVPAAAQFLYFIKKGLKDGGLNKTFYGFLSGNLANWKAGETRDQMIKRCEKSVKAFWHEQADAYITAFKTCYPGNTTKPTFVKRSPIYRALQRSALVARDGLERAAKTGRDKFDPISKQAQASASEIKEDVQNLTWRQRWSYAKAKVSSWWVKPTEAENRPSFMSRFWNATKRFSLNVFKPEIGTQWHETLLEAYPKYNEHTRVNRLKYMWMWTSHYVFETFSYVGSAWYLQPVGHVKKEE